MKRLKQFLLFLSINDSNNIVKYNIVVTSLKNTRPKKYNLNNKS